MPLKLSNKGLFRENNRTLAIVSSMSKELQKSLTDNNDIYYSDSMCHCCLSAKKYAGAKSPRCLSSLCANRLYNVVNSLMATKKPLEGVMAVICTPETQELSTETLPQRRVGGWELHPQPRIALNLGSDDEMLILENRTAIAWTVYHTYHQLGVIDPGELLIFHLCKHGMLNVRPCANENIVEYLVVPLTYDISQIYIYKRTLGKELEVYDLRTVYGNVEGNRSYRDLH